MTSACRSAAGAAALPACARRRPAACSWPTRGRSACGCGDARALRLARSFCVAAIRRSNVRRSCGRAVVRSGGLLRAVRRLAARGPAAVRHRDRHRAAKPPTPRRLRAPGPSESYRAGRVERAGARIPRRARLPPAYARQASRPSVMRSRGRSTPMNTILLVFFSAGSHFAARSLPIIWCTPWNTTLRSTPFMYSTPL